MVSSSTMSEARPILLCAPYRANSPAAPLSVTRRCERCFCLVMTSPSSAPLIAEGAMICCTPCGQAAVPAGSRYQYEMLPTQLDELESLLGPHAAVAAVAAMEMANRIARRRRN